MIVSGEVTMLIWRIVTRAVVIVVRTRTAKIAVARGHTSIDAPTDCGYVDRRRWLSWAAQRARSLLRDPGRYLILGPIQRGSACGAPASSMGQEAIGCANLRRLEESWIS